MSGQYFEGVLHRGVDVFGNTALDYPSARVMFEQKRYRIVALFDLDLRKAMKLRLFENFLPVQIEFFGGVSGDQFCVHADVTRGEFLPVHAGRQPGRLEIAQPVRFRNGGRHALARHRVVARQRRAHFVRLLHIARRFGLVDGQLVIAPRQQIGAGLAVERAQFPRAEPDIGGVGFEQTEHDAPEVRLGVLDFGHRLGMPAAREFGAIERLVLVGNTVPNVFLGLGQAPLQRLPVVVDRVRRHVVHVSVRIQNVRSGRRIGGVAGGQGHFQPVRIVDYPRILGAGESFLQHTRALGRGNVRGISGKRPDERGHGVFIDVLRFAERFGLIEKLAQGRAAGDRSQLVGGRGFGRSVRGVFRYPRQIRDFLRVRASVGMDGGGEHAAAGGGRHRRADGRRAFG